MLGTNGIFREFSCQTFNKILLSMNIVQFSEAWNFAGFCQFFIGVKRTHSCFQDVIYAKFQDPARKPVGLNSQVVVRLLFHLFLNVSVSQTTFFSPVLFFEMVMLFLLKLSKHIISLIQRQASAMGN